MGLCAILVLLAGPVAGAGPAGEVPGGKVVLDNRTPFRCHLTWRTDQVRRADGSLEHVNVEYRGRGRTRLSPAKAPTGTAPPPPGWHDVDFDDSPWPRARPPLFTRGTREIALICARAKFHVSDPASAGPMTLKLTYRGGALVRLNGTELARGHLPKGRVDFDTPGQGYPKEAYVGPEGRQLRWIGFGDPEKHADRFALRDRTLALTVPPSALRKGLNVLALELHRAPASETLYTAKYLDDRRYSLWDMIGLEQVELWAPPGAKVSPNVSRPRGLQVWNHAVFGSVHNVDFGDPNDRLRAIEIVAARNGVFSGQVVVGSDGPIRGLRGAVTALTGPGGSSIPAEAVRVRYGLVSDHGGENHNENHRLRRPIPCGRARRRFDGLAEEPPGELPVEVPDFILSINLKTARFIGVDVPDTIVSQSQHTVR